MVADLETLEEYKLKFIDEDTILPLDDETFNLLLDYPFVTRKGSSNLFQYKKYFILSSFDKSVKFLIEKSKSKGQTIDLLIDEAENIIIKNDDVIAYL